MLVLMFRAAAVGNRFRELTVHNWCTHGYFVWDIDEPLEVRCVLFKVVVHLCFTIELFRTHADWRIVSNHSFEAKLTSASADMSIGLTTLCEKKGCKFERVDASFEYPAAADSLRDAEEP